MLTPGKESTPEKKDKEVEISMKLLIFFLTSDLAYRHIFACPLGTTQDLSKAWRLQCHCHILERLRRVKCCKKWFLLKATVWHAKTAHASEGKSLELQNILYAGMMTKMLPKHYDLAWNLFKMQVTRHNMQAMGSIEIGEA